LSAEPNGGRGSIGHFVQLLLGSLLLLLMLLSAVLSLGIYAAEVRAGMNPLLLALVGPPTPAAWQGQALTFPEGQPDLLGAVQNVTAGSLAVLTPAGTRTLSVDEGTAVRHYDGRPAALRDLARGARVAVFDDLDPATRQPRATTIVLLPPG